MKLRELRAMFIPGQKWRGIHVDDDPAVAVRDDIREVVRVSRVQFGFEFVFRLPDGRLLYTPVPKASEIVEARDGYVRFRLARGEVTLQRIDG